MASHFPSESLFDRVARAVCAAGVLPRKELYEAWEVARTARRRFRGGRVVDLCAGHALLAHLMLILDDSSPTAVAVDVRVPPSAQKLHDALCSVWPRLTGRVTLLEASLDTLPLQPGDVVVSAHACGALTDVVLARATAARARVAVLPCCHHLGRERIQDLEGWMDGALAMDVERATALRAQGYSVHTRQLPEDITARARLLLGEPNAP